MRQLIGKYQFLLTSLLLSAIIVVAQNCENVKLSLIRPQANKASASQANSFDTLKSVSGNSKRTRKVVPLALRDTNEP